MNIVVARSMFPLPLRRRANINHDGGPFLLGFVAILPSKETDAQFERFQSRNFRNRARRSRFYNGGNGKLPCTDDLYISDCNKLEIIVIRHCLINKFFNFSPRFFLLVNSHIHRRSAFYCLQS